MIDVFSIVVAWVPALSAVLAIVAAVIPSVSKALGALKDAKNTEEYKRLALEVSQLKTELEEQIRVSKLLVDQLAKIEGYSDAVEGKK